jgi:hypothetical protein
MRIFAAVFLCLFLGGCGYGTGSTQVAPGSQVGGVGNIQYDHKQLNANTHMATVHVSGGILETEGSMSQRMIAFTNEFAAQTCPKGFDFIADPNPDLRVNALTQRTKVYTFRCV